MGIHEGKIELVKLILATNDESILSQVRTILNDNTSEELWDALTEEQKKEILLGLEQISKGEFLDDDTFISQYAQ